MKKVSEIQKQISVPLNISETLNVFSCFKGSNWKKLVGTNI